ncbi:hypothetical protein [Vulcanisaeta sp. JCM 14467]|uniref:hypothetical protein n=1 Tax=Vulcanisaeta sp. JCM 14467 TaxID=1295370 RepID=UPI0006D1E901|nr:hypothetical protein [Vulcanisaeta sp. JCM 14467]
MLSGFRVISNQVGRVVLRDGTILRLRTAIVEVHKVSEQTPFGAYLLVLVTTGIGVESVPDEVMKAVSDKPLLKFDYFPMDGWEPIDIERQEPAYEEAEVVINNEKYLVHAEVEASMCSRNLSYKDLFNRPLYYVNWVVKPSWRRVG